MATTFEQQCVSNDNLNCGSCASIYGYTRQINCDDRECDWTINCKDCIKDWSITLAKEPVKLTMVPIKTNGERTAMNITSKSDVSNFCLKDSDLNPPSDTTTAVTIFIIMCVIGFGCCVALAIFFFKRKPPMLPVEPKWPEDPNNMSAMENLKNDSSQIQPQKADAMPMVAGSKPANLGSTPKEGGQNEPESPLEGGDEHKVSKAKTLKKRQIKGSGEP